MTDEFDEIVLDGDDDAVEPARPPMDRFTSGLIIAAIVIFVGVLAATAVVVFLAMSPNSAPRTASERAIFMLRENVEANPQSADAWAEYARALTLSEEYLSADSALGEAEAMAGEDVPALVLERARLTAARGDADTALEILDGALAGLQKSRQADIAEALENGVDKQATPFDDAIVSAAILKGDVLRDEQAHDGAVAAYTIALEIYPTMSDVLVARGSVYALAGQESDARADFEKALSFAPDYQPAVDALAEIGGGE